VNTKLITVTGPGSTGSVAYTGVGFQPKVLIAYAGKPTPAGDAANAISFVGAATSSSSRWCLTGNSQDAQATSNVINSRLTTAFLQRRGNTGAIRQNADLVSLDADGFTLDWTTVTDQGVYYILAIGGSDVEAQVGMLQAGAATGNRSITGMSFQPNTLMFFDARINSTQTGTGSFWRPMFGFVDSAGNQCAWAGDSWDAAANATTNSTQSTSACIIGSYSDPVAIDRRATFVSYNSDGFTVNFSTLDAAFAQSSWVCYVALSVPFSQVGSEDQRTSTGTTVVTTTGFTPEAILLGGDASTSTNGGSAEHRNSFGVAVGTGATDHGYATHHDDDGPTTTNTSHAIGDTYILRWITANGATPTTVVRASISAIASGSFTINYDTVDATARKVLYLAMGEAAGGGGSEILPGRNMYVGL
jgi:hypothetical protein